jgi:mono/diheme cytochrome c family protein
MSQKSKKKKSQAVPIPAKPEREQFVPAPSAPASATVADDVEPQVDSSPMPSWFFIVLILLVYWAMLHLDRYAGGFNELVFGPYQSYRQLTDLQPKSGPELLIARGEAVYGLVCIACHQASGLGAPVSIHLWSVPIGSRAPQAA